MTDLTPEQMRKRIADLEEGLRPFAADAVEIAPSISDNTSLFMEGYEHLGAADFDVGDLRKAASLLASAPASEPDAPRIDAAKIAEIRERHRSFDAMGFIKAGVPGAIDAHADRSALLAMIGGQTNEDQ